MQISRVGDLGAGICPNHIVPVEYVTVHISGASTVLVNFVPMAILGTIGATDCGHTTTAVSGSPTVFAEYMPAHRIGDIGVINEGGGEHLVISASGDVGAD